jgi:hypothetical protein
MFAHSTERIGQIQEVVMKKIRRLSLLNKNETAFISRYRQLRLKPASLSTIDRNLGMLGDQGVKELSQANINKPFAVSLRKTDKNPTPQMLEGETDGSISFDHEINAQQRICAWCNTVMREGTKPATHGMCPKCLEEQMHSLEEQKSHSGSEAPVREIFYNPVNPGSYDR